MVRRPRIFAFIGSAWAASTVTRHAAKLVEGANLPYGRWRAKQHGRAALCGNLTGKLNHVGRAVCRRRQRDGGRGDGMRNRRLLMNLGGGGSEPQMLTITATTIGAETVTLDRVTPVGKAVTVDWGDGSTSQIAAGNAGTTTHAYAGAGTWTIKVSDPDVLSHCYLNSNKLTIDTKTFRQCGSNLVYLQLSNLGAGSVINSADFAHLNLTKRLYLYFSTNGTYRIDTADLTGSGVTGDFVLNFTSQPGMYRINSADLAGLAFTLTSRLWLEFGVSGDYTIDSADLAGIALTSTLYMNFSTAGTYSIDTADFAACTAGVNYSLTFPEPGTYVVDSADIAAINPPTIGLTFGTGVTATIAQADWSGHPALKDLAFLAGLSQTQVDAVLLGLYDGFATRTATGGVVSLNGSDNAAPSGVLRAACPPTTGKEAAYELVNDSCEVSSNHWTSVAVQA